LIASINSFNFRCAALCGTVLGIAFVDHWRTGTGTGLGRDEVTEWKFGEDRAPINPFLPGTKPGTRARFIRVSREWTISLFLFLSGYSALIAG
jgi:hypothetical protein